MTQLTVVRDLGSPWEWCLSQDPVRPHIPIWKRVASNREYYLINDEMQVHAVTCVAYLSKIPAWESELFDEPIGNMNFACFYTVWSNKPGFGRKVINQALRHVKNTRPYVMTACTLSPKADSVKKFHMTNGAILFRQNELTDNYVYGINRL